MRETPPTTAPGSQTLARGLNALQLVADAPAGLTVQQVAEGIGVHRTIAYRLLATLGEGERAAFVRTLMRLLEANNHYGRAPLGTAREEDD